MSPARPCPDCGRTNRGVRGECLYCGAALPAPEGEPRPAPPLPPAEPPPPCSLAADALPCPRCADAAMLRTELGALTLYRCERCRGVFLDALGFDYLVARQAQIAIQAKHRRRQPPCEVTDLTVAYLTCPVCRRQMARRQYEASSGVVIDSCPGHGVWLDDSELQRVLAFVAAAPLPLAKHLHERTNFRLAMARQRAGG